jgi:hypothetical protein
MVGKLLNTAAALTIQHVASLRYFITFTNTTYTLIKRCGKIQCTYLQAADRIHGSLFHQGCVQQLYSSLVSMLCTYCPPLHASRRTVQSQQHVMCRAALHTAIGVLLARAFSVHSSTMSNRELFNTLLCTEVNLLHLHHKL